MVSHNLLCNVCVDVLRHSDANEQGHALENGLRPRVLHASINVQEQHNATLVGIIGRTMLVRVVKGNYVGIHVSMALASHVNVTLR